MLCGFVMTFYLLVIKSDWSSLKAFPPARIIKIIELDGQGSIRIERLRTGPGDWSAHVFGLGFRPHTGRTHPSVLCQSLRSPAKAAPRLDPALSRAAVNMRGCLIFMVVGFLVNGPAVPPAIRSGRRSGLA